MSWQIVKNPDIGDTYGNNGYLFVNTEIIHFNAHPLTGTKGRWVNTEPYSKYQFEVEPFGKIDIPSSELNSATMYIDQDTGRYYFVLTVFLMVDVSTGDGKLSLSLHNQLDKCFYTSTQRIAVDVPVHQSVQDAMSYRQTRREMNKSVVNTALGFVDDVVNLELGSAVGRAVNYSTEQKNMIDTCSQANAVHVNGNATIGSYINFCENFCTPKIHCHYMTFTEEFNADKGRPLCKQKVINTLSGYIKCDSSAIESGLTQDENNMIEAYMNGGFFYE